MGRTVQPPANAASARRDRRHKFAVGERVALIPTAGFVRSKDIERDLMAATFEITHLLPAEGDIFHYRIKDTASGQQRVAGEPDLRPVASPA